jgi:hypothetical protein
LKEERSQAAFSRLTPAATCRLSWKCEENGRK